VGTLRAFNFLAMALWLVAPAACSSRITGSTLSARCCAASCALARPIAAASDRLGLPRRTPRALAACSAAVVRSEIISRSCCATAEQFLLDYVAEWQVIEKSSLESQSPELIEAPSLYLARTGGYSRPHDIL
jgi:hypothetical protein